ncbi:hypothetical protein ACHAXR_001898, partial [Thalassiosira sp. AJA248-18]
MLNLNSFNPSQYNKLPRLRKLGTYLFAIAFASTYLVHNNIIEHDYLAHKKLDETTTANTISGNNHHIHQTTANSAWTESHSAYHAMMSDPNIRISFRVHDPKDVPYPNKFLSVVPYMCGNDKADLPPSLSGRTILNFTTTIATNLKIVHLGDSLGQQFVQGFDASVLGRGYESNRNVLQEYFYEGRVYSHNCLSVAAPIRGGGVSSYWRVTDLISKTNRRKEAACAKEELQLKQRVGWSMKQSIELVEHNYLARNETELIGYHPTFPVGTFDCVIMRIPHGWMDIPDITRDRIVEAIHLSHENLDVQTVIITTLPLNNNVLNASEWRGINRINGIIRDIARTWTSSVVPGNNKGVQWVLVQEFGSFTNQILWKSAQHLGYDIQSTQQQQQQQEGWELTGVDFLLDRLPLPKRKWPPSIPMVCAEKPSSTSQTNCPRNKISSDGIHWCIETLGPRYAASIACLLGCVYNNGGKEPKKNDDDDVRKCEQECNDQFMSILPIDERWIGSDTTIFS